MKSLPLMLFMLLMTACSARYGMVLGGQKLSRTESLEATSYPSGTTISYGDYETDSLGFHIGISEETHYILTKIYYFQNSYDSGSQSLGAAGDYTLTNESGIKGSIALKLGFFQPYIHFTNYQLDYDLGATTESDSYTALGFGADLEFDLSKRSFIYVGYSVDSYTGLGLSGASSIEQEIKHQSIYFGLRYNFQENYPNTKR